MMNLLHFFRKFCLLRNYTFYYIILTFQEAPPMRNYSMLINHNPVLSKEEESLLFAQASAGDSSAKEKIISSNMRFVIQYATRFQNRGLPLEDLIQDGIEGMLIAFEKFDPSKNVRFITYAVWWIRDSITKALRHAGKAGVSLDAPVSSERNSASYADLLADECGSAFDSSICDEALVCRIKKELKKLPENERYVINEHFGLTGEKPEALRQIALKMNCSRETVRAYEQKAFQRLRWIA